jgi:ADP-ribosylglycohydrolase
LKAVNLGDDTDTVGAVVGGLAGLYYGIDGIPKEWVDIIPKKEWIMELATKL